MLSLLEAIDRKYGADDSESEACEAEADMPVAIFVPRRGARACVPALLVLNDFDIATAGDSVGLKRACARVEELDLAMNKLEQWSEILEIFSHMPRLKFANLSFNSLSTPLDHHLPDISWTNLRNLVLNSTQINWKSVRHLLRLLPELEELHLSFNEYKKVDLHNKTDCPESNHEMTKNVCQSCLKNLYSNNEDKNTSSCENDRLNNCENDRLQNGFDYKKHNGSSSNIQQNGCTEEYSKEEDGYSEKQNGSSQSQKDLSSETNGALDKKCCICDTINGYHKTLKKLHFSGNHVTTWKEICKLGKAFPNLQSLVLAECPIETLNTIDSENNTEEQSRSYEREESRCESDVPIESPHNFFRKLEFLNLNCTRLATWVEVERLAKFPKLQCLRIQGCPLWENHETTQYERRQLLVARLPNVSILNGGGVIGSEERETAERAFIRYYMDKPESSRPERYAELVSIHGQLKPLANIDLRPEKRVQITFIYKDVTEVRNVDVYRSVADLKTKLESICGIPASRMKLYYVDQDYKNVQGPEEMKYPSRQLYRYNIRSGDEIIIDCKRQRTTSSSSSDKTTNTVI